MAKIMKQILDFEAQERLEELLDEVERGETIIIIRQGRPVAWIVPEPKVATTDASGK